jgi:sec-independent protein translocase protein TatB
MFGLGMGEIMVILVVALLVLGPSQLPDAAKKIGQAIRELRKHTQNLQETIEQDEHIGGTVRELKSALRGDDILMPRPKPAVPAAPIAEGEKPVPQIPAAEPAAAETPATAAPAPAETAAALAPAAPAAAPAPAPAETAAAPAPAPAAPAAAPAPKESRNG